MNGDVAATLIAEWRAGVDRDDITAALFGGSCPTDGVELYTIQPDARTVKVIGTADGCDAVWNFLADLQLVKGWPIFTLKRVAS